MCKPSFFLSIYGVLLRLTSFDSHQISAMCELNKASLQICMQRRRTLSNFIDVSCATTVKSVTNSAFEIQNFKFK